MKIVYVMKVILIQKKILRFIGSHFDKDFEKVLKFYKEKFNCKE